MNKIRLSVAIAMLSIAGCKSTPVNDVQSFADTTQTSQSQINTLISEYNNADVEEKLLEIAYKNQKISTLDLDQAQQKKLGKTEPLYTLVVMNNALGAYVRSLSALSTAGNQEKVELAVGQLNSSLINLDANYQALTDKEPLFSKEKNSQIASIVASILQARAEKRRNEHIEKIVTAANPEIQIMIDKAIALIKTRKFEAAIKDHRNEQLLVVINDYNNSRGPRSSNEERKEKLDRIYEMYSEKITITQEIKTAIKQLELIKKGHSKLLDVFKDEENQVKELRTTIAYLKGINDRQSALETLYSSCESHIVLDKGQITCKDDNH
ncbi:hypothetical protein ACMXYX_08485 [Neptuniibacter sp. QD72_48]|uniref:hypothetical protein n=1 Tax=Neptuniibacter sp. QD72_48 TaxID=3398214 RepID=UPI0039F56AE2